jgi:beta-lactamase regulating signal transducer with metallopeptidase domain
MSVLITSLLISLVAAMWVWGMGRRDPAGRPWLTGLCLALLVVLPLLTLLPKWNVEVMSVTSTATPVSQGGSWQWLIWIWAFGAGLMLVRVARGRWELQQWLKEASTIEDKNWEDCMVECARMLDLKKLPELRVKNGLLSPVVAGLIHPVILMPPGATQWADATRKMALLHELGHVQRRDLWLKLAADISCALHWYNPLVRWMRSKLSSQCEYACDARVIAAGANKRDYIHALCDVVEMSMNESRPTGLAAMADHAPLRTRVDRLLAVRGVAHPWLAILAAALTLTTALGLTLIRPTLKSPKGELPDSPITMDEVELRHTANPFPGN